LITERDKAVCAHTEINGLLSQATDLIIQAAARRVAVPAEPVNEPGLLLDGRLKRIHGTAS
jgi:hypothetical protein